ncbi:hypothetical protein BBJ28_00017194 [Nothophytophthora sp. Chile5]|nr:hypothetical protein BBJ28_00017194 [Nothophytophthora sp. Chile5]
MLSSQTICSAVLCGLAAATIAAAQPTYVYQFDAASAAGVDGSIQVKYASESSSTATITAALDFSSVDQTALATFDGNCTEAVTAYKWHIHVNWNSSLSSDSFKQCSKAATGNHYDPLYACGANSEYADSAQCKAKTTGYTCSPSNYTADPLVCEKGDLSGKFGSLNLGDNQEVAGEWTDMNYPLPSENTDTWSIVLHAVCGSQTPRIACAVGIKMEDEATQSPIHSGCYTHILAGVLAATGPTFVYNYDPAQAAGVAGAIRVHYPSPDSTVAHISVALDFSEVKQSAIRAFSSVCTEPVTAYEWHIHVRWSAPTRSADFGLCSFAATGNHYDPLFACGPDSEHAGSPECKLKTPSYDCNPAGYAVNPLSCEKGDLSGKFGDLVLDSDKKVTGMWVDEHYPLPSENSPEWSIVLHAVCGTNLPRISCAVGERK